MSKHIAYFDECEHNGDLDNYVNDLVNCSATIIDVSPNFDNETANIVFSIEITMNHFRTVFDKTDSEGFCRIL